MYNNTAQLSIISMKLHNRQVVMVVGFYEWAYCYAGQIMTLSAKIILYYTQYIPSIIIQYGFTLAFRHLIKNIILCNCPSTIVRFGYSHYLYDCVQKKEKNLLCIIFRYALLCFQLMTENSEILRSYRLWKHDIKLPRVV